MKINKLVTIVSLLMIGLFAGCEKDDYQETVGICPLVVSTDPADGDTNVFLDKVITVTFNEEMNPATLTGDAITIEGQSEIAGTITYDQSTLTASFTPSEVLSSSTTYAGRVKTTVKDLEGNALQEDYVWTFSTGENVAPMVIATDPETDETDVVVNKIITATFNQPMNPQTINETTFFVVQGGSAVAGTITYSGTTASFTPEANLGLNTIYKATITADAENTTGIALQSDYTWEFTTGALVAPTVLSTDPENNETEVALNKVIRATFSEPMNVTTINGTTFTLNEGTNVIAGVVTYSGTTASFTPSSNLAANTTYTANITAGAENVAGISLAGDYSWEFTTGAFIAPTVISTDPEDEEIDVALDKVINALFSEAMDPATINGTTFTLNEGTNVIAGVITYNGTTASFTPSVDLEANTTYSATITAEASNVAGISLVANYNWEFTTEATTGFNPIDIGSAERFGILSGVGVSNNAGPSEIHNLDVGIYPGFRSSITGFMEVDGGPGLIFNGGFYAADDAAPVPAMLLEAKDDLMAAYLAAEGATAPAPVTIAGDIGGQTLAPGIYKSTSTLLIQNGNLTLDAQGDPNAFWIFQIAADFTTVGGAPYPSPAGGNIILSGGANADNIIWQVGSSVVIGDYTSFKGNILALTSVTMNAFAQAEGRMLCTNGAVVLTSTNFIFKP